MRMPEPTTSTGFIGIAAIKATLKALGGMAFVASCAAAFAAIVVMLMTRPSRGREWVVSLICTVISSIGGGAAVVMQFNLNYWANTPLGLCALGGLIFTCGLPGWALVRWAFNYLDRHQNADISDVIDDVKGRGFKNEQSEGQNDQQPQS